MINIMSTTATITTSIMFTSTVLVAEVWKPPDVGEVDGEPDDREKEVQVASPCLPLSRFSWVTRMYKTFQNAQKTKERLGSKI